MDVVSHMYKLPVIYDNVEVIPLPTCMYKLPKLTTSIESECVNAELQKLEERQQKIINDLLNKKNEIDSIQSRLNPKSVVSQASLPTSCKKKLRSPIHDIVIYASPKNPPVSLLLLKYLIAEEISVIVSTHVHSSLHTTLNNFVENFMSRDCEKSQEQHSKLENDLSLTIIWKEVGLDPILIVDPLNHGEVSGEVNILRYICRLLNSRYYDESDPVCATEIDSWLDTIHVNFVHGNNKQREAILRTLNASLGKQSYVCSGSDWTVADLMMWACLSAMKLAEGAPSNVKKWYKSLSNLNVFSKVVNVVSSI